MKQYALLGVLLLVNRSASAVKLLMNLGYTHIYDLGGINGWPYKTVFGN